MSLIGVMQSSAVFTITFHLPQGWSTDLSSLTATARNLYLRVPVTSFLYWCVSIRNISSSSLCTVCWWYAIRDDFRLCYLLGGPWEVIRWMLKRKERLWTLFTLQNPQPRTNHLLVLVPFLNLSYILEVSHDRAAFRLVLVKGGGEQLCLAWQV